MTSVDSIEKELYLINEYGTRHQNPDAVLSPESIEYMKKNFNIDTTLHSTCINCQARQMLKYGNKLDTDGKYVKSFTVPCKGIPKNLPAGSGAMIDQIVKDHGIDRDVAIRTVKASVDPVAWAELMFGFSDDKEKWRLRNYQKEQLRCTAQNLVVREGRRTGKTFMAALKLLHVVFNKQVLDGYSSNGKPLMSGPSIMIVTPYQAQILNIFDEMERLLKMNAELKGQTTSGTGGSLYVKTPFFHMDFANGGSIKGFVSGVGTKVDGSGGGTMRGQCLPADTLVLLADGGSKPIKDIKINDSVLSVNEFGSIVGSKVTHVFEPNFKKGYKVTLASGRSFVASADHGFGGCDQSKTNRSRKTKAGNHSLIWKPVKEWAVKEFIAVAMKFPEAHNPFSLDELYMIGLMTGDGCCTLNAWSRKSLRFSTGREEVAVEFVLRAQALGFKAFTYKKEDGNYDVRITGKKSAQTLWNLLTRAGVAGCFSYEKILDPSVLTGTESQRRALLGSLLSTDGWITNSGRHFEVGYVSTSKSLAKQVQHLMQTLGVSAKLILKPKGVYRDQWVVSCKNPRGVVRLLTDTYVLGKTERVAQVLAAAKVRKLDGVRNSYQHEYFLDRIISIEPASEEQMFDIEVAGAHNFLIEGGVVTHNSAHWIYLDEMDMIPEETIEKVVMPILLTDQAGEVSLLATSTPIGKRGRFYKWCLESPNFKEDHLPSTLLPQWGKIKGLLESENTEESMRTEFMAEFVDSTYGVFKSGLVYAALKDYEYPETADQRFWDAAGVKDQSKLITTIGIDWNKNAGTEFCVTAYDMGVNKYFVLETVNISAGEFSSVKWKEEVIRLNYKYGPDYIYADEGYGHTIIEDLKLLAMELARKPNKNARELATVKLSEVIKSYNFSSNIELRSPLTGTVITKSGKEFLVENAIRVFEDQSVWLSVGDQTLLKELLHYVVLKRSKTTNKPIYGADSAKIGDHRLDAFMLSLAGPQLENGLYSKNTSYGPVSAGSFVPRVEEDKEPMSLAEQLSKTTTTFGGNLNVLHIVGGQPSKAEEPRREIKTRITGQEKTVHQHYKETLVDGRLGFDTDQEDLYHQGTDTSGFVSPRPVRKRKSIFGRTN